MSTEIVSPLDDEDAPLNDPAYDPVHKPVNGRVPDVVIRWGKRSQLRWFERFWSLLLDQRRLLTMDLSEYWCDSEHHKGLCCGSCESEFEDGFGVMMDGWCCCHDPRMRKL